ncbi:MAG: AAA family ATPase [Deltaproteobacteria bacterium]|nr:AAA family ATPase [Deltaproteobacteria bacterium]MCX7953022.1 AAA family ATPase [Deltaproteobacteria bacterium]
MLLRRLHLDNFLIFRDVVICFSPGLNIICGESGTGKSLILKAIADLFYRYKKDMIGVWKDHAKVSLSVELNDLESNAKECTICRKVCKNNKQEFSVFPERDYDFEGHLVYEKQFGGLRLFNPKFQLQELDSFGGISLDDLSQVLSKQRAVDNELKSLEEQRKTQELLQDLFNKNRAIFEKATLIHNAGYDNLDQLIGKKNRCIPPELIEKAETIWSDFKKTLKAIENHAELNKLKEHIQAFDDFLFDAWKSYTEESSMDLSEDELYSIKFLIQDVSKLLNKNIKSLAELVDVHDALIDRLKGLDQGIIELKRELADISQYLKKILKDLSDKRVNAFESLKGKLGRLLSSFGFDYYELSARFEKKEVDETGEDDFEILVSFNKGIPPRPLRQVASGGELNRFLVALAVASHNSRTERASKVYLFDEIDSGLSGQSLECLYQNLVELSKRNQVILVSHHVNFWTGRGNTIKLAKIHGSDVTEAKIIEMAG